MTARPVLNIHERALGVPAAAAGQLLVTLASEGDGLWPVKAWPRMKFDRPLAVGAVGGHGPIRYFIESIHPGERIDFRFTGPRGFNGGHRLEVVAVDAAQCILRHTLQMRASGVAIVTWPLLFEPLHNALLEDALSVAQASLGLPVMVVKWSPWVRALRWLMSGGRAGVQPGT